MMVRATFPGTVSSVTEVRHLVVAQLPGATEDVRDVAEMLVSELATNCVRHTGSDFEVSVEVDDDRIRVEVVDHGPGQPELKSPAPSEPSGRGLQIVGLLASDWGVSAVEGGRGKMVWFELSNEAAKP